MFGRPIFRRLLAVALAVATASAAIWYYWVQPSRWRKLAFQAAQAHQLDTARYLYEKVLRRRPGDSDTRLKFGQILDIAGETDAAVQQIYLLPNATLNQEPVLINMGRMLISLNRFTEAESHLRACVEQYPDTVRARQLLLDLYRWQNRDEESLKLRVELSRLAATKSTSDQLWVMLRSFIEEYTGVEEQENWEQLVRWWEQDKEAVPARIGLARLLILRGDRVEEAAKELETLLQVSPGNVAAIASLLEYYTKIEGASTERAEELIAQWPTPYRSHTYWGYQGLLLEKNNDDSGAIAAFRQALALRPDDRVALGRLVALLTRLGRSQHDEALIEQGRILSEKLLRVLEARSRATRLLERITQWLKEWGAANRGEAVAPDAELLREFVEFYEQLGRDPESQRWLTVYETMKWNSPNQISHR